MLGILRKTPDLEIMFFLPKKLQFCFLCSLKANLRSLKVYGPIQEIIPSEGKNHYSYLYSDSSFSAPSVDMVKETPTEDLCRCVALTVSQDRHLFDNGH